MTKTILYALSFVALGLITASLGPTLPLLAAHAHASTGKISFLFAARSAGTLTGALLLGRLYDHRGGHPLLGGGLLLAAAMFALVPQLPWFVALAVAFLLVGIGSGSINVGGNILMARVNSARVGPHLSLLHFAYGLGAFLTPLLAKLFAAQQGELWRTYALLAGLIASAGLLLCGSPSPALSPQARKQAAQTRLNRTIALLLLFFFLEVGAEIALSGWLFIYAIARGASENTAFYLNSAFWAAFTLGRLGSIPLLLRFTERQIVITHLIGWVVLLLLCLCLPNVTAALWLCAIGAGWAMAPVFPLMLSFTQRTLHLSGQITGWVLVASGLSGMTLPWLIGQLFEPLGAQVMLWAVLIDLLAGLLVLFILLAHVRTITEPTPPAELEASIYEP